MKTHRILPILILCLGLQVGCETTPPQASPARMLSDAEIYAMVEKDKPVLTNWPLVEKPPGTKNGYTVLPKVITAPVPQYPKSLRREKLAGKVLVRFVINESGDAEAIEVLYAAHPLMGESCRIAVANKKFVPGTVDGKAVKFLMRQMFYFSI
ncbi:MAG: energy transducer TonB [Verrucomicrobiota bacterium]|nr:energy transducer TonB [Verrucomicrobiota bacterium]